MPKKAGIAFIAFGAVLILSALLLLLYNRHEDQLAGQEAESLLADVEAAISERSAASQGGEGDLEPAPTPDTEMPVVELNGYGYVGYIEVPALELELPVMSDWDYERLTVSPCRQFGSSRSDDLVIVAHNYSNHFGRLKYLSLGETVVFTDMDGIVNTYTVEQMSTLQATDVAAVQNSDYELVLYTCTTGGSARVTLFCRRVPEPSPSPAAQPALQ